MRPSCIIRIRIITDIINIILINHTVLVLSVLIFITITAARATRINNMIVVVTGCRRRCLGLFPQLFFAVFRGGHRGSSETLGAALVEKLGLSLATETARQMPGRCVGLVVLVEEAGGGLGQAVAVLVVVE
jgi:hypothetical protein